MPTNLLHHGSQNRIQETSRNMAARKGPRLYKKQSGTQREKKHVLTLTLMLVRRKSACKTSAGSSKILRWLTPLLGPNLDPKTGPKQRPKRRNQNVIQFWTPFWVHIWTQKMGSAIGEFRCCPHMLCKQICDPGSLNMNVNSYLFLFVQTLCVPSPVATVCTQLVTMCMCARNWFKHVARQKDKLDSDTAQWLSLVRTEPQSEIGRNRKKKRHSGFAKTLTCLFVLLRETCECLQAIHRHRHTGRTEHVGTAHASDAASGCKPEFSHRPHSQSRDQH